ncbi:MAG: hypothetical protein P8J86_07080 [Phycisphaerales bacterium]|nr:hypothetical protein [Phycisphaerales bacterium]
MSTKTNEMLFLSQRHVLRTIAVIFLCATVPVGCVSKPNHSLMSSVKAGNYSDAREAIDAEYGKSRDKKDDRNYMLTRMREVMIDLADGKGEDSEDTANEVYEILRTQGINRDKTISSVVLNEDLKFWKGEPFEQAMSYAYVAVQKGQKGEWDNTRAAANQSLFMLKDFGQSEYGGRKSGEDIAVESNRRGRSRGKDYLDSGYVVAKTNFVYGHLLSGAASWVLGRKDEARDQFRQALKIKPKLKKLVSKLESDQWNTLLVVDYGLGPQKVASGPDNAIASFRPWNKFGYKAPLQVKFDDVNSNYPIVCNLDEMSADHMWNNLEDVRVAKSVVGTGMMVAGGVLLAQDDDTSKYVGLGLLLAGAVSKAGAHADTRYCEIMPQRVYLAPIKITHPDTLVSLKVAGQSGSKLHLFGINPPAPHERATMHYVRLNSQNVAPEWATADQLIYTNDTYSDPITGSDLPFILGGKDVRRPTNEVLMEYQAAGNLTDLTLGDLEELYRAEGIALDTSERIQFQQAGGGIEYQRHILEGGRSLVPPEMSSAAYSRIFAQEHPPYQAKSEIVRELRKQIRKEDAREASNQEEKTG